MKAGHIRNLAGICRDHRPVQKLGLIGSIDCVSDQGLAEQGLQIFSWQGFLDAGSPGLVVSACFKSGALRRRSSVKVLPALPQRSRAHPVATLTS